MTNVWEQVLLTSRKKRIDRDIADTQKREQSQIQAQQLMEEANMMLDRRRGRQAREVLVSEEDRAFRAIKESNVKIVNQHIEEVKNTLASVQALSLDTKRQHVIDLTDLLNDLQDLKSRLNAQKKLERLEKVAKQTQKELVSIKLELEREKEKVIKLFTK